MIKAIKIITLNASGKSAFAQLTINGIMIGHKANFPCNTDDYTVGQLIDIGDAIVTVEYSELQDKKTGEIRQIPWFVAS